MKPIAVVAFLLLPASLWAQTPPPVDETPSPTFEIVGGRERLWLAGLGGHIRVDGSAAAGTPVDVESTFHFDASKLFNDVSAWVNIPVIPVLDRVNFGYWFGGFHEQAPVTASFRFGNTVFGVGDTVDTTLDFDMYTVSIESFPLKTLTEPIGIDLGIQLGVKWFDVSGRVRSETLNTVEEDRFQGPLPIVGLRFIGQFTRWVRVEGELVGIGGSWGGVRGTYLEGAAEIEFTPIKQLFVGLGYKFALLKLVDEAGKTFDTSLDLNGFFLSVGLRF